jgi:proline iminopeptidase
MRLLFIIAITLTIASCKQNAPSNGPFVNDYFNYGDSVESAGVKMIPIKTPVGDFKVWTKRFGSNPKI